MAATNMFEPGWILINSIENRLGDLKQVDPARLKPIPIFYGTPNFPIIIVQTKETSPSQTSMADRNMFESGLNPDWFDWGSSRGHQTTQSSPAQNYSHFLWNAKLPYILCSDNKFFSISNFHGGYKYVWAVLNPDWFQRGSSMGLNTVWFSPAQTQSHFLWDAQTSLYSLIRHWILLHLKLPWRLQIRWSRAESWLVSSKIVWGTWNYLILPGSDPFPFSMGRQTSLYSLFRQ